MRQDNLREEAAFSPTTEAKLRLVSLTLYTLILSRKCFGGVPMVIFSMHYPSAVQ